MKVTHFFCFNANRFLVDNQSETTSAEPGAMPQRSQIFTALYKLTEVFFHRRIEVSWFTVAIECSLIAYF